MSLVDLTYITPADFDVLMDLRCRNLGFQCSLDFFKPIRRNTERRHCDIFDKAVCLQGSYLLFDGLWGKIKIICQLSRFNTHSHSAIHKQIVKLLKNRPANFCIGHTPNLIHNKLIITNEV